MHKTEISLIFDPTLNLLMVMVLVWSAGVLFRKFKQPPVLGELFAGIIFGPSILGIIQPDETLKVLSELGVFFLMFYAGIETNPMVLKRMTKLSFIVGIGGFIVPMVMGYILSVWILAFSHVQGIFIGLALSITAIAVNARVLNDFSLQKYRITPVIIGASIVDDVLSFAVFSSLIGFFVGITPVDWQSVLFVINYHAIPKWYNILFDMAKVILFFAVTIFTGMKVFPLISKYFGSREAKGFTFALIVALIFGLLAKLAGLHIILGAYMAGLFVREGIFHKDLFQKINDRFVSITYGFFGPIFFVSLSFHMTFSIFTDHYGKILLFTVVAIIGKTLGAGVSAYLGKMNYRESTVVALAMNGRGAVELIIASVGLSLGIIDDVIFSILVVMAFVTTLIPPLTLSYFFKRVDKSQLVKAEDESGFS